MTHTPHLEALRSAVAAAEQARSAEDLQPLIEHMTQHAKQFKSFKRVMEVYPAVDDQPVFLLNALRAELCNREELESRDIFTTAQAAEYLDLSIQSIKQHYSYTGYLKGEMMGKKTRVFRKSELDEFMNNPQKRQRGPKELKPEKNRFKPKKGDQNDGQ